MKLITYALFKGNETFLFNYHLRGIYFNVRMNNLLCPEWKTWVAIEEQVYDAYNDYFVNLQSAFGLKYMVYPTAPRCEAMLWRLKPIWFPEVEVVTINEVPAELRPFMSNPAEQLKSNAPATEEAH